MGLCLLGSIKIKNKGAYSYFVGSHIFLLSFLFVRFSVRRSIFFYVGFECCLIPVFMLIVG